MAWDLSEQPEIVQTAAGYAFQALDIAKAWLISPAAWSQFALLILAFAAAWLVTRRLKPLVIGLLTPPAGSRSPIAAARRFALIFLPLMLPLLAYLFTAVGEGITRTVTCPVVNY